MSNIITAQVKISGTRPLLQHRFGPEVLPLAKQEKRGVPGHDPDEWRESCMITPQGQLYIRGDYVFACLREGAKYTKSGRSTMQQAVQATLQVLDDQILLDRWFPGFPRAGIAFEPGRVAPPPHNEELPVYLDVRGVRNPRTRGRNVRYRIAAHKGWTCAFTLQWDKTIISREVMQAILIDSGQLVGIGNARAIGMGRFEVVEFVIQE